MQDNLILAIETSCDETAVAVIKNGNQILSNIVNSQIKIHQQFGGVVPEVAARKHVENISLALKLALKEADINPKDLAAIAYTAGPGLIGALHVGALAAKSLAFLYDKPLIATNHLFGHIMANKFVTDLEFPLLALIVSGGHSELVLLNNDFTYQILGQTLDDAIGEAYDKVARVLGLPYPGGVEIDKLANTGRATYTLPEVKTPNPLDFSFSGLKSAVLQLILKEEREKRDLNIPNLARSFQEAAIRQLLEKTQQAIIKYQPKHLVLAGGVAANSYLRSEFPKLVSDQLETKLTIPPLYACTDNAAMIGAAAYELFKLKKFSDFKTSSYPSSQALL